MLSAKTYFQNSKTCLAIEPWQMEQAGTLNFLVRYIQFISLTFLGDPSCLIFMQGVTFNSDEEMAYVVSIMPRIFLLSNITLIVSTLLKDLWGIIQLVLNAQATERMKHGIMVLGPRGTGKTTSLLYVMKKLKENSDKHCILLISSSCGKPVFLDYLKWFCDGMLFCILVLSLVPRPFEGEEEKGPGTHCVRMRYFPSKSWEFVFLSA